LAEKLAALADGRDEHLRTGILTPGFDLAPAFPRKTQWLLGVCSPLQWRNRPRFSRSSRTPDGVQLTTFKERVSYDRLPEICKRKIARPNQRPTLPPQAARILFPSPWFAIKPGPGIGRRQGLMISD
jgi:hypothetical protein